MRVSCVLLSSFILLAPAGASAQANCFAVTHQFVSGEAAELSVHRIVLRNDCSTKQRATLAINWTAGGETTRAVTVAALDSATLLLPGASARVSVREARPVSSGAQAAITNARAFRETTSRR